MTMMLSLLATDAVSPPPRDVDLTPPPPQQCQHQAYHQLEYQQQHQPLSCSACGLCIRDRFFLQTGECVWHDGCLRCAVCKQLLDREATCYCRQGVAYCKEDYARLFKSGLCARCGMRIDTKELVMRVTGSLVYHLSCFACAACNRRLNTGDSFGLQDSMVYCRDDYHAMLQAVSRKLMSPYSPGTTATATAAATGSQLSPSAAAFYNGAGGCMPKGRPRRKRVEDTAEDFDAVSEDFSLSSPPRQKRMRTSFKHNQIRTMKAYFSLNHNPDAKDLKQLAEKTGLSKRVLQVWFQNARAKFRRSLLRQDPTAAGAGQTAATGSDESATSVAASSGLAGAASGCEQGALSAGGSPSAMSDELSSECQDLRVDSSLDGNSCDLSS